MTCPHKNFSAHVNVACFDNTVGWAADVTLHCSDCQTPFQFLGLSAGVNLHGATVSVDGLEARLAVAPKGTLPSFLDWIRDGLGMKGH